MSDEPKQQPSFSPRRRWKIGFDMTVRTLLVLAVVVMLNFIGTQFSHRFFLSSQTSIRLSPQTISVLRSLTNQVAVTLYYDKDDDLYPTIVALLNEYHSVNPKISVRAVDYLDAGEAEKVKVQYNKFIEPTEKNLVIFDCDHRVKIVSGNELARFDIQQTPGETKGRPEFVKRPTAFIGEKTFTAMLLELESARQLKVYFLQGDGEPALDDSGENGYMLFASILRQDYLDVQPLELRSQNAVPDDCNLLVVAGPRAVFSETELQKISQYLAQGGRLFALFNYSSARQPSGLEAVLVRWGVDVGPGTVQDPKNTTSQSGEDVLLYDFSQHPVVNPLTGLALQLLLPRPVGRVDLKNPPADAPQVTELAASSPSSTLAGDPGAPPRSYPLMVAVEQRNTAGVANPRGATRMVVTGDSYFLDNKYIAGGANRDFVSTAANWLLARPQLLDIGPRPVTEFKLLMTAQQQQEVRWLLLAALPGAVLLLGGLVWAVRRK